MTYNYHPRYIYRLDTYEYTVLNFGDFMHEVVDRDNDHTCIARCTTEVQAQALVDLLNREDDAS